MNAKKERELCAASLDHHVEVEGGILEEYRTLAGTIEEGPISFLIDFILAEEEHHHGLLRMMAKRLRDPMKSREDEALSWVVDRQELMRHMQKLREHEREMISACQHLKTQAPPDEAVFFDALLDAIILDSEKHQRLLLAVEKLAQGSS